MILLPGYVQRKLMSDYYKFEVTFEDAANMSNGTYNSNDSRLRDIENR